MTEIINFISEELEKSIRAGLSTLEARQHVDMATRERYGGETVRIQVLPKANSLRAVQLAKLNQRTNRQIAEVTGLSIRRVQQLLKK